MQPLVLREFHAGRVVSRSDLSHRLGLARGFASELTARLRAARLVAEEPLPADGRRGRPTTLLVPHPRGPLVQVADIAHERWAVAFVELGGKVIAVRRGRHDRRDPAAVLGVVATELAALATSAELRDRLWATALSVPGTVQGSYVAQASNLNWRDVAVGELLQLDGPAGSRLVLGNDATLSGLAEARRGAARDARVSLNLKIDVGVGGVLVDQDQPLTGATGAGGEFGHMPFGDPTQACRCGAYGCWELDVDGRALARLSGRRPPRDPRATGEAVLDDARAGDGQAIAAVETVARAFGRGIGALVNAFDPSLVTVAALGADFAEAAPEPLYDAYVGALMRFRRADPPPILRSTLGADSSLIGAAELAFDSLLTEDGLHSWRRQVGDHGVDLGRLGGAHGA